MKTSEIINFDHLSPEERRQEVAMFTGIGEEELAILRNTGALDVSIADRMSENVIGTIPIPLALATNFLVNGKEYLVPMAVEESWLVGATSDAAKLARSTGGFFATNTGPVMRAQIQIVKTADPYTARLRLLEARDEIIATANAKDPMLISLNGGVKDIEIHIIPSQFGDMVILHLLVDTRDAMGANTVNTMAEAVAPLIAKITGGRVYLKILSNLADKRLVRVRTTIGKEALGGAEVVDGILYADTFAAIDPYRAATHNKGIMNAITPVVLATGNDTRAVEAGAHAYAAISGRYTSLTHWEKNTEGDLAGMMEIPMAVGLVGGATKVHPVSRLAIRILGVQSAVELGEVIAAAGLAMNLANLRALATEGIQQSFMTMHARKSAISDSD